MKSRDSSPAGYYMIGIVALFMAGFLMLVVIGAQSFQNTVSGQSSNMSTRAILSWLATCAKSGDTAGALSVQDSSEGRILVLEDGDTGFAQRIYLHEGKLVEDYARINAPLHPEDATVIGPTDTFEIRELPGHVLSVRTDEGRVLLHMRSREVAG